MLTFNGKKFNSRDFEKSVMDSVAQVAKDELGERFRSIRHPLTGEFPTVIIYGDDLSDMSMKVEGSKELLQHITEKISEEDLQNITLIEKEKRVSPKVFLSFGWEDKKLAENIAKKLLSNGIDTWWAEWEISSGDSLRQRIDDGLGVCTHFIVLLSPTAMEKPWVKQEMDAGLVRMLDKKCKFIPLRFDLPHNKLPPLLMGHYSPEITNEINLSQLINDIHGISKKPALGKTPISDELPDTGYSVAATTITKIFCDNSETGTSHDPMLTMKDLVEKTQLTKEDVEDGLYELRAFFTVQFDRVMPASELFVEFDKAFMEWEPEKDALRIASAILNDDNFPSSLNEIASKFDWTPRRINPAVNYLVNRSICRDDKTMGAHPWTQQWVNEKQEGAIRRFVKSRS
ncbi:MAG: toll/interleukin-1 receptor domain-containing protein [Alphaproteobacteria bacterium]|nr:toll/interleukin-1 receptor domain-containing protein [Alphaproteobacteria bacterium]